MSMMRTLLLVCVIAGPCLAKIGDCTPRDDETDYDSGLDFGDCDWMTWAMNTLIPSLVPVGLGLLFILCTPFLACCRCCYSCCCKDKSKGSGTCCGLNLRIVLGIAVGLAVTGLILVWVGNGKADSSYNKLFDGLHGVPSYINSAIDDVVVCAGQYADQIQDQVDDIQSTLNDFSSQIDDTKDSADNVEKYRMLATWIMPAVSVGLLLMLVLIATGLLTDRCPCETGAFSLFVLVLGLTLLVCGICAVVLQVFKNLCPEFDDQLHGRDSVLSGFVNQACDQSNLDDINTQCQQNSPQCNTTCVSAAYTKFHLDDCTMLFNIVAVAPLSDTCDTMKSSLELLVAGLALQAVAMFIACFLAGTSFRKVAGGEKSGYWGKHSYNAVPQEGGEDADAENYIGEASVEEQGKKDPGQLDDYAEKQAAPEIIDAKQLPSVGGPSA